MSVREIFLRDAEAASQLSGELGYPATAELMTRRIAVLAGRETHTVLVACIEEQVVGWVDIGIVQHLQGEPYGEIGGMVVSNEFRGAGIGRQLLARAEQWIAGRGIAQALVRSQIDRQNAHHFYLREGYSRIKTSAVFTKPLAPSA